MSGPWQKYATTPEPALPREIIGPPDTYKAEDQAFQRESNERAREDQRFQREKFEFEKNKAEYVAEFKARAQAEALTTFVTRLRQTRATEIQVNERFLEARTETADDS